MPANRRNEAANVERRAHLPRDAARFHHEPAKESHRTDFERDRARILHSAGLRRLGTKTQVLVPAADDFARTRLTHSLEVAQIGRGLAQSLGCEPDVVDAACLAHDLGHPPFGHNGERALDEVCADIGGFEGNAQTFRLVTRLEPKVLGANGEHGGLNLTRATLDAIAKYPWGRGGGPNPDSPKFGAYDDDMATFLWMRQGAPAGRKCLEAQVMDLADDIAYSVHDFEDAVATGGIDLSALSDAEVESVIESTIDWYGASVGADRLREAARHLTGLPWWPADYDGTYASQARLKDTTSSLIGGFIEAAHRATREQFGSAPLGRYDADLVVPDETLAQIAFLKGLAVHYVMAPRELEPLYYQQRTLIHDLVDALSQGAPGTLEEPFATEWRRAPNDAGRLRAVVDQVACLTDFSASKWHARLCGMLSTLL